MSQGDRFTYSSAPVRGVKAMQFGILDPDFIVSMLNFGLYRATLLIFQLSNCGCGYYVGHHGQIHPSLG